MSAQEANRRRPSRRVELARLAAGAIALDGALEPTAGDGRWVTADGQDRIQGVLGSEDAAGRIDLELHLLAHWPTGSLEGLAAGLRRRLAEVVRSEGLAGVLGAVDITIHDLVLDEPREGRPR